MTLDFDGEVWSWRGPAPHHFVSVPADECADLAEAAAFVTYGWGMIPVTVTIGGTTWTTSLFPKDGGYVVPLTRAQLEEAPTYRPGEDPDWNDPALVGVLTPHSPAPA